MISVRCCAAVGLLSAALILPACSAGSASAPVELTDWDRIALPASMVPSSLLSTGDELLVGGYLPGDAERTPALVRLPPDGNGDPITATLQPTTPYGEVADLVSLTAQSREVVGLGAARGGAHANFRWTIWTGTADGLTDLPQTFETFGGWEAGALLGLATDRRGPLIVGTWQGAYGLEGAVWRADGQRWIRQPPDPALANSADQQVAPRTVSQQADQTVVVNGSVVDLSDGVRQSAVLWRDVAGSWTRADLAEPGRRSEAWSTVCTAIEVVETAAQSCTTVGSRDGRVALWSWTSALPTPELEVDESDRGVIVADGEQRVAAVTSRGRGRLLIGQGDEWQVHTSPDGVVAAAALVGTRLYLITAAESGASLWVRDLDDVLNG